MDIIESIKKECKMRGFSNMTAEVYCFYADKFLDFCKKKVCLNRITKIDVKNYLESLCNKDKCGSTLNVALSSVKFLLYDILHKKWRLDIKFSKRPKRKPVYLTKHEVGLILNSIDNLKHKLMIKLLYSAGLRVGELVRLKVCDLDIDEGIGWVRLGKGSKDRMFIIAKKLREELRDYVLNKELGYNDYVFGGRTCSVDCDRWKFYGNKRHISIETVYQVIKKASKRAKVLKNVHPHTFRHSFARHLVDDSVRIYDVQFLLGHADIKTTEVYTHMSKRRIAHIDSPYDCL